MGFCPDATMKQEVVTPEVASQYLRANIVNRKLRPTVVKRYEEEMRQNSWTLTSDAIAFDEDGNLIQGQHRLNAVVKTGLAQVFWVARNMPNDSRQNLDSGSKRELHDRLTIAGHKISRTVGSTCIMLISPGRIQTSSDLPAQWFAIRSERCTIICMKNLNGLMNNMDPPASTPVNVLLGRCF